MSKGVHQAVKYCQLDTDQCYADAQKSLGVCYYYGDGGTKDKHQAVNCYQLAADQGHDKAHCNLGIC